MAFECSRYGFLVDVTSKLLRSDGDGFDHVLGDIVALVVIGIEIGVLLGEDEGLMGTSVLVKVSQVEAGVSTIVAAAGVEDPASVA